MGGYWVRRLVCLIRRYIPEEGKWRGRGCRETWGEGGCAMSEIGEFFTKVHDIETLFQTPNT